MIREEIKRRAELYSALAEGKTIQFKQENGEWTDLKTDLMCGIAGSFRYRIKPELKYRPFKTKEECWIEMHKHPDLGWVKRNVTGEYMQVIRIYGYKTGLIFNLSYNSPAYYSPQMMLSNYTFTDGTLFGIKEE